FGTEQFLVDGLIMLYNLERREKRVRALEVLKMRGTSYIENLVPFKITTSGIEVYMSEKVF
ncbi:circadian clock protein KaiC, partial [Candidatus Micrarchaeota archaeon]|nr:circadian clock protein KaiC [Candidatus Micrarchaeota archaeon]